MSSFLPAIRHTDAVILAGGRGLRMDGADKGLLRLQGRPLVTQVHAALCAQVDTIVVSANRNAQAYAEAVDACIVADEWPDFRGPLAGISAGFAATRADWLLAVPADMPGLPDDLVAQLQQGRGAARAAYAEIDGDAVYPLCLLHRSLAGDLRATLQRGEYAVRHWLARQQAGAVTIRAWQAGPHNLNTPALLAAAEQRGRA